MYGEGGAAPEGMRERLAALGINFQLVFSNDRPAAVQLEFEVKVREQVEAVTMPQRLAGKDKASRCSPLGLPGLFAICVP